MPWRSAFKIRRYVSGPVRFVLANSGHIAGVISPPGGKGAYVANESTTSDPEAWLAGATQRKGSWWEDWLAWLGPRSGQKVAPPSLGNETYKPIEPAPGSYVREMGGEVQYRPEHVEEDAEAAAVGGRAGHVRTADGRLDVELGVGLPSVPDRATAAGLVARAHDICPYANATCGNIPVESHHD